MLFTDDFIGRIKDDPSASAIHITEDIQRRLNRSSDVWTNNEHEILLEGYALLEEMIEQGLIPAITIPGLSGEKGKDCVLIDAFLSQVHRACSAQNAANTLTRFQQRFRATLGNSFVYEFSQGDLDRTQTLINELRQQISNLSELDADHKRRLLARLEKLQAELHKKVSDLDRFWGLIGDAGVVLGKLGTDAKPIVDRIRDIAEIVWRTQSRAEELPSGTPSPLIGHTPSSNTNETESP